MILIIGGSHQGKRRAAARLAGRSEEDFLRECVDGEVDAPHEIGKKPYVCSYHLLIGRILEAGGDPQQETARLIGSEPEFVVMDEVGCGVVPVNRGERAYREAVGLAGQMLAGAAEEVYRVVCGIPVRIR